MKTKLLTMIIAISILLGKNLKSWRQKFFARLAQANIASKNGNVNFVKKTYIGDKLKNLNKKITSNQPNHVLVENESKKLHTFDLSLFIGQSYFNNDGAQIYLIFQLFYYTLERLGNTEKFVSWNVNACQPRNLVLLQLLIIVFLHHLNGTETQIFV